MHDEAAYWEYVAIAVMRAFTVFLAFAAFLYLKRTDQVVLKARIYLSHRKVLSGLLFLGIAMSIFLAQVIIEIAYIAITGEHLPLVITGVFFILAVAFLIIGFRSFYSLARAPVETTPENKEGRR